MTFEVPTLPYGWMPLSPIVRADARVSSRVTSHSLCEEDERADPRHEVRESPTWQNHRDVCTRTPLFQHGKRAAASNRDEAVDRALADSFPAILPNGLWGSPVRPCPLDDTDRHVLVGVNVVSPCAKDSRVGTHPISASAHTP
jgi:hypothetical protein